MLAALLPVALPSAGADDWYEYRNSHFLAVSNAPAAEVRSLLSELERFRATVQMVSGVSVPADAPPDVVIVFRDRGEYRDFAPARSVVGHVIKGGGGHPSLILMPAEQMQLDSEHVIRHEYVHALLVHHVIAFPRWYEEGLAELLSTARFEGSGVVVGLPPQERLRQKYELLPFDRILSEEYNPHQQSVRFGDPYLQYWLLTSYLLLGNPDRRPDLEDYLRLVHLDMPSLEAFKIAFGLSPQQFWDAELQAYAMNLRKRGRILKLDLPTQDLDLDFRAQPLSSAEVEVLLEKLKPVQ